MRRPKQNYRPLANYNGQHRKFGNTILIGHFFVTTVQDHVNFDQAAIF